MTPFTSNQLRSSDCCSDRARQRFFLRGFGCLTWATDSTRLGRSLQTSMARVPKFKVPSVHGPMEQKTTYLLRAHEVLIVWGGEFTDLTCIMAQGEDNGLS